MIRHAIEVGPYADDIGLQVPPEDFAWLVVAVKEMADIYPNTQYNRLADELGDIWDALPDAWRRD